MYIHHHNLSHNVYYSNIVNMDHVLHLQITVATLVPYNTLLSPKFYISSIPRNIVLFLEIGGIRLISILIEW